MTAGYPGTEECERPFRLRLSRHVSHPCGGPGKRCAVPKMDRLLAFDCLTARQGVGGGHRLLRRRPAPNLTRENRSSLLRCTKNIRETAAARNGEDISS